MCAILGIDGFVPYEKVREGFERTVSRGPDMSRLVEIPCGYLGFHRLAIMGLDASGMQPFTRSGHTIVCNGELYGFREKKAMLEAEGEHFVSASDCEILLPLYERYGLDLFRTLDAEFALILFDASRGHLVAARDPIGIRPLYYGYLPQGSIAFASEPKNLLGICEKILPFPPGHYYADGQFVCYADPSRVDRFHMVSEEEAEKHLHDLLYDGIRKRLDADAPLGFLLSGGLDSSLVCAVASRILPSPIRTFSIGMDKDAIDLKYARQVAEFIGSEHTEVIMTAQEVREVLREVIWVLGTYDITTIRASIGMYLVCRWIHQHTDVRVLLTGEISDELFGYKYTDFAPSPYAFQKEAEKRIHEIHMYDVLRADRCISANSLEARVPFGDLAFVEYAMSIDPRRKMNTHDMGKFLIRHAFEKDQLLPESILYRQKAAFSDAVGHSMVDDLKALAEETYPGDTWKSQCQRYTHATPFTKESLMYREIFEELYPGQSEMVQDFWMPNRSWPGCDVDDPSARVLKNYGASGT
ncbi:MAG: asparagine synthase B [Clostridia bacterium]|nr:asparagine synthase B [Clostridia bacterium]